MNKNCKENKISYRKNHKYKHKNKIKIMISRNIHQIKIQAQSKI